MEEAKQETLISDEASSKDKDKELGSQEDEVKESKPSSCKSKACSRQMSKRLVMVLLLLSIVAILLSTVVTISFSSFYSFEDDETGFTISIKPKRVIPESSEFVGVWELTYTSDGNLPDKKEYEPFLFHFEQYEEVNAGEDKEVHRHRRPHHLLKLSAKIGPNTLSAPVRVFPEPRRGDAVDIEVGPVSSTHNQESEELEKLDSILKEYLPQMTYSMEVYEPFGDYKNGRLVILTMEVNPAGFGLRLEPFDIEDEHA